MGDLIKKQKGQIMELLGERHNLRNELTILRPMKARLEEAEKVASMLKEKVRQLVQDISEAVEQRSIARTELAELKQEIESLQKVRHDLEVARDAKRLVEQELRRCAEKIKTLESDDLRGELKTARRRLQERSNELTESRKREDALKKELAEKTRRIQYLESNEKLHVPSSG